MNTGLFQGSSSVQLDGPNGEKRSVDLFKPMSTHSKSVSESVESEVGSLTGEGSTGRKVGQACLQILSRAGAVTASTMPLALLKAGIPAFSKSLQAGGLEHDHANEVASAVMNMVGFAAIVGIYFKALGLIGRTLPQRSSDAPQPPGGRR